MHKLFLCALFVSVLPLSVAKADIDMSKPLDVKFTAIDGRKVDLAQLRGKVVLIDFWATWCPPCQAISPDVAALYGKYHKQGLEIVGISVDSDKSALLAFIKEHGEAWPQYFDEKGDNELISQFGVESFPTLWLLDKKGMVVITDLQDLWVNEDGGLDAGSATVAKKVDAHIEMLLKQP